MCLLYPVPLPLLLLLLLLLLHSYPAPTPFIPAMPAFPTMPQPALGGMMGDEDDYDDDGGGAAAAAATPTPSLMPAPAPASAAFPAAPAMPGMGVPMAAPSAFPVAKPGNPATMPAAHMQPTANSAAALVQLPAQPRPVRFAVPPAPIQKPAEQIVQPRNREERLKVGMELGMPLLASTGKEDILLFSEIFGMRAEDENRWGACGCVWGVWVGHDRGA